MPPLPGGSRQTETNGSGNTHEYEERPRTAVENFIREINGLGGRRSGSAPPPPYPPDL